MKITLYELVKDEKGNVTGLGGTYEFGPEEAKKAILAGTHKHERAYVGELPEELGEAKAKPSRKSKAAPEPAPAEPIEMPELETE